MNNRNSKTIRILAAAFLLALTAISCQFAANSPATKFKTIPSQTVDIQVPMPDKSSNGIALNLEFWAGEMKLAPGSGDYLASGKATFNVAEFTPKVDADGTSYTLRQGDMKIEGITKCPEDVINTWELQVADTPMSLNIKAGAYKGTFELGGLSLENLTISEGGSDFTGIFSEPNHVKMSSFNFSTGGSRMELKGLANANFEQMTFQSGAGDYTLGFDGALQRDASVKIETGASTVNLIVPKNVNARVTFNGGLSSVKAEDGWTQSGNTYTHSGSGPTITITVEMGVGTLNLKTG